MSSFSRKSYVYTAAAAACLGMGAFWLFQRPSAPTSKADEGRKKSEISATRIDPLREDRRLLLPMQDGTPGLRVVMDEVCVRDKSGLDMIVKLDPPATPATIRQRMAEFSSQGEVLPVAYPENGERNDATRALITHKMRVQLPEEQATKVATGNELKVSARPEYAPGWSIMDAADPFAALAAIEGVRSAEGVASADVLVARQRFKRAMPNDPMIGQQWHLKNSTTSPSITHVNVENVWNYASSGGYIGTGTVIGIVDDGLQADHPDLFANVDTWNDYDWNSNDDDSSPALTYDNHGTACAGVAAASGNNGVGVCGVAPGAVLVGMRLISAATTDQQEAEAMAWKSQMIHIKSNSWGPDDTGKLLDGPGPLTAAAITSAASTGRNGKGTIFVWAGGNGAENGDNSNYDGYANRIETIAVGGMDSSGGRSARSEPGANLLISAPTDGVSGMGIVTTDRRGTAGFNTASGTAGDYHTSFGGTSAAAPIVSGVVSLMLARNPSLGWRDVQEILIRSATHNQPADTDWQTNSAGLKFNHKFGAGLVNAEAAVGLAATWVNLASQSKRSITSSGSDAIPDGGLVTRTITVPGDTHRIETVTVTVTATHSRRGDLAITLTSPSGMKSRLAEQRNDTNPNYSQWTFSSVRHWGEFTGGNWTLEVEDMVAGNSPGATLGTVVLGFNGISTGPMNPAPQVQITSPTAGQAFSPGSSVTVSVSATDLTVMNAPGEITQVELLMDGLPVGTVTTPPYQFTLTPTDGSHTLVARATDTEGEIGTSPTIQISLQDQPPTIHSVMLSAVGQILSDTDLTAEVTSASDPEGAPISYTYQWEYSTDDRTYTVDATKTTKVLLKNPANVGKLWRCLITPSDGTNLGATYQTFAVNVLNVPPAAARLGSTITFPSGLVVRGVEEPISRQVIINEVSQGEGDTAEWVELLMLQSGSLVGWTLGRADYAAKNIVFKDVAAWRDVPAGKLIIIYKGTKKDGVITYADNSSPTGTGPMVVKHNDATLFENASLSGAIFPLSEPSDSVNLGNGSELIHRLTFGTVPVGAEPGAPQLGALNVRQFTAYTGGSEAGADDPILWSASSSYTNATPGNGYPGDNAAFINRIRTNDLIEIPPYRKREGVVLPAGLSVDPVTGLLSGTISATATLGDYPIAIERYNKDGETVIQSFTLRVFPRNYAEWASMYTLPSPSAAVDSDGDGVPNLVEYLLDRHPKSVESGGAFTLSRGENEISLLYQQSKFNTDYTLVPEWSTELDGSVPWQTGGISLIEDVSFVNPLLKSWRASLPVDPAEPRKFLRLRAVAAP